MESRKHVTPVFTTICVMIGVLVTIQLWLLSASVEAMLGGRSALAVPATIASAALFAVSGGLLRWAMALDRRLGDSPGLAVDPRHREDGNVHNQVEKKGDRP